MKYDVIIIGAGAAGLFLAANLDLNIKTLVLEKNAYPGKKLNITGKGRCNITNVARKEALFDEIFTNKKFFYSSFDEFNNEDTQNFFEKLGLKLKVERGGRVFPISDKARDVTNCLYKHTKADFKFEEEVVDINKNNNFEVITKKGKYESDYLVIATGGLSYPTTGSTGDGYRFLRKFGHQIVEPRPALVGLEIFNKYKDVLQGISLRNVSVELYKKKKKYREFGEMLFTHYGVSGPIILRLSPFTEKGDKLVLDLKPALDIITLEKRIQRDLDKNHTKIIKNSLNELLLSSMIEPILELSGIDKDKPANLINKAERHNLANSIKNLTFQVMDRRPIDEAVITDGGVSIKEISPKTLESKLQNNLFVVGELLDIAANTGGYNLQVAFSTAYKVAKELEVRIDCDKRSNNS